MKPGHIGTVLVPWLIAIAGIVIMVLALGWPAWTAPGIAALLTASALLIRRQRETPTAVPLAVTASSSRALVPSIPIARPHLSDGAEKPILLGSLACSLFFGGLAAWSVYAPIERTATGPAILRYEADRAFIRHPDGGVITELLVKEGEAVGKGQVLLRLATAELAEELRELMRRRDALLTQNARLLAEQAGADTIPYPQKLVERAETDYELAGLMASENSALRGANDAFQAGAGMLNQRITDLEQRVAGIVAQKDGAAKRLHRTEEERNEVEQLIKRGLTPADRLVAVRHEHARLSTQVQGLTAEVAEARAALDEARQSVVNFRRDKLSRISLDLTAVAAEIAELEPRIEDVLTRLARAEIKSPSAGVVTGVTQFAKGAVLPGGVPVLQVVSTQKRIVAEARIHPFARGVLEPGMPARVRLITAGLQETTPVGGRLVQISADAVTDRETNEAYYVAIVEIPHPPSGAIRAGTPAEVVIPILDRTPLHYLFEPLVRKRELAMRTP